MAKHECPLCGEDYDTRYDLGCPCYLDYPTPAAWQVALTFRLREEERYWRSEGAEMDKGNWLDGMPIEQFNNRAPAPLEGSQGRSRY